MAQQTASPYSMYGYGLLGDRATSMQRQMGGVGYAMTSGRQINVMNPASYARIDSLTFLFDIGADLCFINTREADKKQNSTGGGLDYLTMQFPFGGNFGGSIGLVPVSSVGYAFGNEIKHGAMENQGSGGLNELYVGVAGRAGNFSLGANFSYMFGNVINDVYATPEGSSRTLFEHVMQIRDWNVNIGLQYSQPIGKYDRVTLGLSYIPRKPFLGKTWVTSQNLGSNTTAPDTIAYANMRHKYQQPNTFGAGISYLHTRQSYFLVEVDYTFQQWSKAKYSPLYSDNGQLVFQGMDFSNRYKIAAGAEYSPKLRGPYFQRVRYRVGGFYTNDYLRINSNRVREYGITAGFGLPTPEGKTMINLGFEWKHRMTSPTRIITENYFNITLGINFNEVWFWQRKIK